jgi:hypothetical protein
VLSKTRTVLSFFIIYISILSSLILAGLIITGLLSGVVWLGVRFSGSSGSEVVSLLVLAPGILSVLFFTVKIWKKCRPWPFNNECF